MKGNMEATRCDSPPCCCAVGVCFVLTLAAKGSVLQRRVYQALSCATSSLVALRIHLLGYLEDST